MSIRRQISSVLALASLLILVFPSLASADVNDFAVTSFKADYYLTHADKQGALDIDEHINVDFSVQNHGILRALPERYNGQPLHVKVTSVTMGGSAEHYTTSTQNGNLVLKIGNANTTVTGAQSYEIKYQVVNVMRFVKGHDELDWNVNGDQWQQPFYNVQATLHYADPIQGTPSCFTGSYGGTESSCSVQPGDKSVTFTTTRNLQIGETLTYRADFATGTFAAPTFADQARDYARPVLEIIALPVVVFAVAFGRWRKFGRDIKGRGTIIPEYGPPAGLGPLAVDTIAHYKLGTKAISATIIDHAIRKYVKISETTVPKLLGIGDDKIYNLQLLTTDFTKLNSYEREILDAIFGGELKTVSMNSLKNKFYKTAKHLQTTVPADLTTAGYFTMNPRRAGSTQTVIAMVLVFGGFFFVSVLWQLALSCIISGLILGAFGLLMPKRSQQGVDAKDTIDGLKLYMEVAEKDRIKMLQSPDAPYAQSASAPSQTVELFEKLLPYAIVLGVENAWAKKFESIYTTPPDWYNGNWTAFNAGYLVGSLNSSMAVMSTSFSSPASSGGGAGGGFSGGGGGGGGGGGW